MLPVPESSNALVGKDNKPSTETHRFFKSLATAVNAHEAGKASVTQTWEQSFFISSPTNKDYRLVLKAALGRTITNVVARTASGTCNLTVKIDSTGLGAGSAIAVTSTESDTAYTTNNVLAVGQDIVFTVASASSPVDLSVTLYGTLTLA